MSLKCFIAHKSQYRFGDAGVVCELRVNQYIVAVGEFVCTVACVYSRYVPYVYAERKKLPNEALCIYLNFFGKLVLRERIELGIIDL